jgi:hypothetical protein
MPLGFGRSAGIRFDKLGDSLYSRQLHELLFEKGGWWFFLPSYP